MHRDYRSRVHLLSFKVNHDWLFFSATQETFKNENATQLHCLLSSQEVRKTLLQVLWHSVCRSPFVDFWVRKLRVTIFKELKYFIFVEFHEFSKRSVLCSTSYRWPSFEQDGRTTDLVTWTDQTSKVRNRSQLYFQMMSSLIKFQHFRHSVWSHLKTREKQ